MHGERYPDATAAGAVIDGLKESKRQLEAENEALRETLKLVAEEAPALELRLKRGDLEHD